MTKLVENCGLTIEEMRNNPICIVRNQTFDNLDITIINENDKLILDNNEFVVAATTNSRDVLGMQMLDPEIIIDQNWYQNISGRDDANRLDVYLKEDATAEEIALVRQVMKELHTKHPAMRYSDYVVLKHKIEEAAKAMKQLAYMIVVVLTAIGFIGVINTLQTSIYRRKAEISTFRVVGMTQGQVVTMIIREGLQYGFLTIKYGMPIGIVIGLWLLYNLTETIVWSIIIKQAILGSAIILLLCTIFSIPTTLQILRGNMIKDMKQG